MSNLATPRTPKYLLGVVSLDTESLQLADGSIWSHAATLGTRHKGDTFTIDQPAVENFVKVFSTGYPQKIPVDYEHGSTSPDPEIRKLRAQGQVPKAGDVLQLQAVFSAADFTGDLKTAAERLSTAASRPLEDPRNLGLWMRWKPTARALQAIRAGEYSELSIAFDEDWPNNVDGAGQGPTVLAVGLVMRPFLDDMLPVAASADDAGDSSSARSTRDPAEPDTTPKERTTMTTKAITMLSAVAVALAKPLTTEEEAIEELTAAGPQIRAAREYSSVVGAELGETDPVKAAAAVRELKAQVKTATELAATQKSAAIKTSVDATMETNENKFMAPLRALLTKQLTAELEAGAKLEETETVRALASMKPLGIFEQSAGPDVGGASLSDDAKLTVRVTELLTSNDEVKAARAEKGQHAAYMLACDIAEAELLTAK